MACNTKTLLVLLLCVLQLVQTLAQSSPEPSLLDPISLPSPLPRSTEPTMHISTAGRPPFRSFAVPSYTTVFLCPSRDYPTGFSVRCDLPEDGGRTVFWRVNDDLFKKEHHAPYFISGNWRDRIAPFSRLDDGPRKLRITCKISKKKGVWINLVRRC